MAADRAQLTRILPEETIHRSYWLVYHESVRDIRRIAAVADFIRDCVSAERAVFAAG